MKKKKNIPMEDSISKPFYRTKTLLESLRTKFSASSSYSPERTESAKERTKGRQSYKHLSQVPPPHSFSFHLEENSVLGMARGKGGVSEPNGREETREKNNNL